MFRGFEPKTNLSITKVENGLVMPGKLILFSDIQAPIRTEIFGIDGATILESYISGVHINTYANKNNEHGPNDGTVIVTSTLVLDIQNILHALFKFVHIYPAQGFSECPENQSSELIVRMSSGEDELLGLGLNLLLDIPQDGDAHHLPSTSIVSMLCIPKEIRELANLDERISLLKAHGASVYINPYI